MAKGVAIKIDESLFRDIHVRAAERGLSVQQYVNSLIEKDLFPERRPRLNERQLEVIREAARKAGMDIQAALDVLESSQTQENDTPDLKFGKGVVL